MSGSALCDAIPTVVLVPVPNCIGVENAVATSRLMLMWLSVGDMAICICLTACPLCPPPGPGPMEGSMAGALAGAGAGAGLVNVGVVLVARMVVRSRTEGCRTISLARGIFSISWVSRVLSGALLFVYCVCIFVRCGSVRRRGRG